MYWRTPDVSQVTAERTFFDTKHKCFYGFVRSSFGKKYSDLNEHAVRYYQTKNKKYFGQIITYLNFLGLLQLKLSEEKYWIVDKNNLLEAINRKIEQGKYRFAKDYINYFLVHWQFPAPNIKENRHDPISKPFLIILKTLILLHQKSPGEGYFSYHDFYKYFNEPTIVSPDEITDDLITNIIDDRARRAPVEIKDLKRKTGYYKALLKESYLITDNSSDYPDVTDFMIGLVLKEKLLNFGKYMIEEYKTEYFDFNRDVSSTDKGIINEWAIYVNDKEKFIKWRKSLVEYLK